MSYDRQLIPQFLCGDPADHGVATTAKAIDRKAARSGLPSKALLLPSQRGLFGKWTCNRELRELNRELGELTGKSRLHSHGHGDWKHQHVGLLVGPAAADALVAWGMPTFRLISITARAAPRDLGTSNDARMAQSADSYASNFHRRLRDPHGMDVTVHARLYNVAPIDRASLALFQLDKTDLGRKTTADQNDDASGLEFGRKQSKVVFEWVDERQRRRYAH